MHHVKVTSTRKKKDFGFLIYFDSHTFCQFHGSSFSLKAGRWTNASYMRARLSNRKFYLSLDHRCCSSWWLRCSPSAIVYYRHHRALFKCAHCNSRHEGRFWSKIIPLRKLACGLELLWHREKNVWLLSRVFSTYLVSCVVVVSSCRLSSWKFEIWR